MPTADCLVSVVAPLRDDGPIVEVFVSEILAVLKAHYTNYELVLVDDGSQDDTQRRLSRVLETVPCVRVIRLSREFGTEIAITAGLDSAIGDFVVVMIPNMDPPALIPEMVRRARSGPGIVFGVRRDRSTEPLATRLSVRFFHWFGKQFLRLDLPKDSTHFRVLSRQAVNAMTRIKDKHRYLRLLSAQVGYANEGVVYDVQCRHPKAGRGLLSAVEQSVNLVVASSPHPLRLVSWLGLIASMANATYVLYVVGIYLFKTHVAEGWTTLSLQNASMFFFVFLILTVLSEYIGRILEEAKDRPLYHVLEERASHSMIVDAERRNIVKLSTHSEAR